MSKTVDFYRQGASVASDLTMGASAGIIVDGIGEIGVGDSIRVGIAGPTLSVTAVNWASRTVTATNSGGSIFIREGTRLILLSRRPDIYDNPSGTGTPVSSLTSDASTGEVSGFINVPVFDYICSAAASPADPSYGAVSSTTMATGSATLSWTHTASGSNRAVFVAVSWVDTSFSESLDSVTYAGQEMTLVASSFTNIHCDLFMLGNPPTTTNASVVVTWSGTNTKNAAAAAISYTGVEGTNPVGPAFIATDISTAPSVSVDPTSSLGVILSHVAVFSASSGVTFSSSQTVRWNSGSVGTSPYRVQGAALQADGTGSTVAMSGTLSASKRWVQTALQLNAYGMLLVANVASGTVMNVADFANIQDAVDAIGEGGGDVLIPAGTYNSTSEPAYDRTLTLPTDRPIRIFGEGQQITILEAEFTEDMVLMQGDNQSVEDLTLKGKNDPDATQRGIVIQNQSDEAPMFHVAVRRVTIRYLTSWGLYISNEPLDDKSRFSVFGYYEWIDLDYAGVDVPNNDVALRGGVFVGGAGAAGAYFTTAQVFSNCRIVHCWGVTVHLYKSAGISFRDCAIESQQVELDDPGPPYILAPETSPYVLIEGCSHVTFDRCWFEAIGAPTDEVGAGEFIYCKGVDDIDTYRGISITGCNFVRTWDEDHQVSPSEKYVNKAVRIEDTALSVTIVNCDVSSVGLAADDTEHKWVDSHIFVEDVTPPSEVTIVGGSFRYYDDNLDEHVSYPLLLRGASGTRGVGRIIPIDLDDQSTTATDVPLIPVAPGEAYKTFMCRSYYKVMYDLSAHTTETDITVMLTIQSTAGQGLTSQFQGTLSLTSPGALPRPRVNGVLYVSVDERENMLYSISFPDGDPSTGRYNLHMRVEQEYCVDGTNA